MRYFLLACLFILGCNYQTSAQATATASQTTALSLSNAIAITFVSTATNAGTAISLPFATVADYTNGVTSTAQQLKVQSNKIFNVTINTTSPNFTYTGTTTPTPVMPVSGVLAAQITANATGGTVATAFNGAYASLTSAAQALISTCSNGGNQTFSIQYKTTPGFAYPAGTYTASVLFTATQP